jgi:hypothetical protein
MGNNSPVATLEGLLGACEFVTLHVPLSEGTNNLLGAPQIAAMRQGRCAGLKEITLTIPVQRNSRGLGPAMAWRTAMKATASKPPTLFMPAGSIAREMAPCTGALG